MFHARLFLLAIGLFIFSLPAVASVFSHPQPVHIKGLPVGAGGTPISTEEPFISRDGRFLFFNTGEHENNKDMHYAERVGGKWIYRGEIGPGINTEKDVQGNPTMDSDYNFFFVDGTAEPMVRVGRFLPDSGLLEGLRDFEGVPNRKVELFKQKFHGNMGVEISADGAVAFFSRATWDMNLVLVGQITGSDLLLATRNGDKYIFDEAEARRILQNINTPENLEYAASVSADGLELFFTRLEHRNIKPGQVRSAILRATRRSLNDPFDEPEVIAAIGESDFVEGPAISANGRELYYHKREGKKFRLYRVSR